MVNMAVAVFLTLADHALFLLSSPGLTRGSTHCRIMTLLFLVCACQL